MQKKIYSSIRFFCLLFIIPLNIFAQCFTAPYGQKPLTTQTIANCNGIYQTIARGCANGEYSKVNVTSGNVYSFKSTRLSDFITISDDDGTIAYATGTGIVTWTATLTTVVRFYTHANDECASDNKKKKRQVACTMPVSCSSPGSVTASSITNTTTTISWNTASPEPSNGYEYEIRISGAGGSGSSGLVSNASTAASVTTVDITGLTSGTLYIPYVRSNCGTSFSSYITGNSFITTSITSNLVPAFSHIVVVIGENTSATSIFGSANAPYINALAAAGAKFTNSFALSHPSQPNYLQLYSGSNQGITDNSYITTKYTTANLGRELIDAGKAYKTYSDGLPSVGYDGISSGLYVRKHNPAANWMGTGSNQIPASTNQPFTAFPTDFTTLPNVSFVVPDLCNDGHDVCSPLNNSVRQFDSWVQTNLDAYKQWCINNNSLLIITYDEDDYGSTNKIATVFYGANVSQNSYSQTINHYNVLRTIEEANRLTTHAGAAATAGIIDYCWAISTTLSNTVISKIQEGNTSERNIYIFPNPASDKINVVLKNMAPKKYISWEITDITGKKFKSGIINNATKGNGVEIPVHNLKSGAYLLRISDGVNTKVNKFVKSR